MIGTVCALELRLGNRRNRMQTARRVYAAWLIGQFLFFFLTHIAHIELMAQGEFDRFASSYVKVFVVQHFFFLLLAVPAFVAGTVTDEKAKGTLLLLLTTDLNARQIVLGKFLGGLAQVALLAVVEAPVFCFVVGYAGYSVGSILALVLLSGLLMATLGALSMWASVRFKQTRDAVLRVYIWCGLAVFAVWAARACGLPYALTYYKPNSPAGRSLIEAADALRSLNPVHVLDPAWGISDFGEFFTRLKIAVAVYAAVGIAALTLAVWRLRPVTVGQLAGGRRRQGRAPWRSQVDEYDPVRWRERTAGSPMWRWAAAVVVLTASVLTGGWLYTQSEALPWMTPGTAGYNYVSDLKRFENAFIILLQGLAVGLLTSLVVGIRASGSVSGERERKTWESLLLTPVDTWDLVVDKRAGTMQAYYPILAAYALPTLAASGALGLDMLVLAASNVMLTLAMVFYMASTGVWCSVTSASSWRSLVATLAFGYGRIAGLLTLFAFVYLFVSCGVFPFVFFFLHLMGVDSISHAMLLSASLVASAGMTFLLVRNGDTKIHYARSWIDAEERYGRTLTRSLTRALLKHYEKMDERRKAREEAAGLRVPSAAAGAEAAGSDDQPIEPHDFGEDQPAAAGTPGMP